MNPVLAVTNAAAGSTDADRVEAALAVLRRHTDVRREDCARPEDLARALDAAAGRDLVIFGGDGSVHTAVAALFGRGELRPDRPIGIIPLGTGNDLARTLGLPLDPVAAAELLVTAHPRPLDLFVDDAGGVVVNLVHLGIGAEAAAKAGDWKDRLGPASYAVGALAVGAGTGGWDLTVEVDGAAVPVDDEVLMVAVANGRTIGGGAELAPDALLDDGLADVVVATSTGLLARLGFAVALREGEHVGRDDVLVRRGRQVVVRGQAFPLNADGELSGPVSSRTWTVRPGAWSVRSLTSTAGSG